MDTLSADGDNMNLQVQTDLILKLRSTLCLISVHTGAPQVLSVAVGLSLDIAVKDYVSFDAENEACIF